MIAHETLQRDTKALSTRKFDVLVVGAGVYGAWTALDAARRGLSVALIDQNDFGSGTSANSQKILHGGLRYLQHADLKRMRESIRERSHLLKNIPHLCHVQPFLVPTYTGITVQNKMAMRAALRLNDLVSFDRNYGMPESRILPPGRLISKSECLAMAPGLEASCVTGGAVFYDGQVMNSERFNLALVRSAIQSGVTACNYVKVVRFVHEGESIAGVAAQDTICDEEVKIRASMTILCTGPWTAQTLQARRPGGDAASESSPFKVFRAVVLVTRDFLQGVSIAIKGRAQYQDQHEVLGKGYRNYFITPWKDCALVGTFYSPFSGDPDSMIVREEEIRRYIEEFNSCYRDAKLTYADVRWIHAGLLPLADGCDSNEMQYQKHYSIVDHEYDEGFNGLLTVVGVKWTTARDVAEKAVDLAMKKLGKSVVPSATSVSPALWGCDYGRFDDFVRKVIHTRPAWLSESILRHLVECYGSNYDQILKMAEARPELRNVLCGRSQTIAGQVLYAVRSEMAITLCDVLLRRTLIGTLGWPGATVVRQVASVMASELGWNEAVMGIQIRRLYAQYERLGVLHEN